MEEGFVVLGWFGVVGIIGLNGFSAGLATVLYLWRRSMRPGGRIALSCFVTGALPASFMLMIVALEAGGVAMGFSDVWAPLFACAIVGAGGMIVSLPGAIIVSRKLAAPGDHYRAFE